MRVIALETSTEASSVALVQDGRVVGEVRYHFQKAHSALLSHSLEQLLNNCQWSVKDATAVVCSNGPGSYTGLRIGASLAKGLCFGANLPLIPLSPLDNMVYQIKHHYPSGTLFCPVMDARRNEVYLKLLDSNFSTCIDLKPYILDKDEELKAFTDKPVVVAGNAAAKTQKNMDLPNWTYLPDLTPQAAVYGKMVEEVRFQTTVDPASYEPNYLKPVAIGGKPSRHS